MLGPFPMIGAVAAVLLAVNLAAAFTLSQSPHPVLDFKVQNEKIVAIDDNDEVIHVKALSSANNTIKLTSIDFLEEPDLLSSRKEYNRFMDRQGQIHDILTSGSAQISTVQGEVAVEMKSLQTTPLSLSFGFS